jgi:ABC-type spermidine/putrescine transport system permease subunit I
VLGGAKSTNLSMLIDNFVNEQLVWPLAAAASMILLAACLATIAVIGRAIPVSGLVEAR